MNISVNVTLAEGEELGQTPDDLAAAILDLAGGDPDTDHVMLNVLAAPQRGGAGTFAVAPPPEEDSPPA